MLLLHATLVTIFMVLGLESSFPFLSQFAWWCVFVVLKCFFSVEAVKYNANGSSTFKGSSINHVDKQGEGGGMSTILHKLMSTKGEGDGSKIFKIRSTWFMDGPFGIKNRVGCHYYCYVQNTVIVLLFFLWPDDDRSWTLYWDWKCIYVMFNSFHCSKKGSKNEYSNINRRPPKNKWYFYNVLSEKYNGIAFGK